MSYRAHERLVAPARATARLWQLGLGICIAMVVMFGLSRAVFAFVHSVAGEDAFWTFQADLDRAITPGAMLALLCLMGAMGIATLVAAQIVHRRGFGDLIGGLRPMVRQALRVLTGLAILYVAAFALPPWPKIPDVTPGLPPGLWMMLLPATLTALLIQVSSEELLFRGYLQSQLAARFAHPLVWLTVPSALFAVGHHAPDMFGENAIWITLWAFFFGLVTADLTARSGTLGPAIALHLANNFMAIAVLSLPGEMSGLALYQLPFGTNDTEALRQLLPMDLMMLALSWLTARIMLRV